MIPISSVLFQNSNKNVTTLLIGSLNDAVLFSTNQLIAIMGLTLLLDGARNPGVDIS